MHRVTQQEPIVIASARIFTGRSRPRNLQRVFSFLLRWLTGAVLLTGAMNLWAAPFTYVADSEFTAQTNDFSVIEMTGYSVLSRLSLRRGPYDTPIDLVANPATGKIFIEKAEGLSIVDPALNAITTEIPIAGLRSRIDDSDDGFDSDYTGRQTLAVSPDGSTAYLLGVGSVIVVDVINKIVTDTIKVDPSAITLIGDREGEAIYVGNTGLSRRTRIGPPSITVIDTALKDIDDTILMPTFFPIRLAVTPDDGQLYVLGYEVGNRDNQRNAYAIVDLNASTFSIRKMPVPADAPPVFNLLSLQFNQKGDRVYFGTYSFSSNVPGKKMPVFEIDTQTGNVLRTLHVSIGYADNHWMSRLAGSFADDKFRLVVFTTEHLHHYPADPPRRAVLLDVQSDTVLKEVKYSLPNYGVDGFLVGDVLDEAPAVPLALRRGISANTPKRAAVINTR
jgi:DNA-binding beta-propeller fold protein YncE